MEGHDCERYKAWQRMMMMQVILQETIEGRDGLQSMTEEF